MVDAFRGLVRELRRQRVRFVVIGVSGANYYAESAGLIFVTQDRDIFLPPDASNARRAWRACEASGLELFCGDEPLDRPRDSLLAREIVKRRALVRATGRGLDVDLTFVMAGFEFEVVWNGRRAFLLKGVRIPVARLSHIVASKARAGRPKDRLFLATHEEALRAFLESRRRSR